MEMRDIGGGVQMPVYHNTDYNIFVKRAIETAFVVEHSSGTLGNVSYEGPFIRSNQATLQWTADRMRPVITTWLQFSREGFALVPKSASGTAAEQWK